MDLLINGEGNREVDEMEGQEKRKGRKERGRKWKDEKNGLFDVYERATPLRSTASFEYNACRREKLTRVK